MSTNCGCEPKKYNLSMGCCVPVLGPVEQYYTKYQTDKKIEEAISGITGTTGCCITPEEVDEKISAATDDMATQEWVENKGYITGVDLSDYATLEDLPDMDEYALKSEIPSLSGYATEQWVEDKHYITGVDLSDYVTYDSLPDLGELATKEWVINQNYATNAELIQYIANLQQQIDSLKQQISGCCGDTGETLTRWITMTGDSNYTCSGTTKMTKEKEQTSADGINWTDTGNYRTGSTVLEEHSIDCGYSDCAYCCDAKLSGDSTVYTPYTWVKYYNGVLEGHTTEQGFFQTNRGTITHMTFNECVKKVGSNAFYIKGFTSVEYIDIPATVTEIGHSAFNIGTSSHFTTMVVRATTPPALSSYEDKLDSHGTEGPTFKSGGRNLKIYVPDAVVNTYKTTPRWSNYADIIYPISQLS